MRKGISIILLLFAFCLTGEIQAATYTVKNLPIPYLQDRTRHVTNPDNILSSQTVRQMDDLLHRMETERGVQSIVAVVEHIDNDDCYEFAITLGNSLGVGNRQNTGLIILLSTQDRCYYILTGEGLEGTLPDAICRRIENRQMVPSLKIGDWDQAMLNTVKAVCGVILEDESLLPSANTSGNEDMTLMWITLGIILIATIASWYSNRKKSTCPKCGKRPIVRTNSKVTVDRLRGVELHETFYRCPHCGHTINRSHREPYDNGTGFGGFPPIIGPFHRGPGGGRGFGGGFSGGSFGGGSFGGGGAGGRF